MWECLDFYFVVLFGILFGVDILIYGLIVKYVLKISVNDKFYDYYSVGSYIIENDIFFLESVNLDVGIGLWYDYGKFYVFKLFFDQVKRCCIFFGWVNEFDSQEVNI